MRTTSWLVAIALLLATPRARAEAEGDALIESGLKLRREHRDSEALEQFARANALRPSARARAQMAFAEQALGRWVEAETDLLAAMAEPSDHWIAAHAAALQDARNVIQNHLGTVSVKANVPNAEIWVEGTNIGQLPKEAMRLPAGTVHIEARANGFDPALRTIELEARTIVIVEMVLSSIAPTDEGAEASPVSAVPPSAPPETHSMPTRRVFAWATLGLAGAFLVEAGVAQAISERNTSIYNDNSRCFIAPLSRDERCGVYRGQAESAQRLANVGYVAAGSLAIASTILFISSREKPQHARLIPWVDATTAGARLGCAGDF